MYEYNIKDDEIDMVINKTYKFLNNIENRNDFQELCWNICNDFNGNLSKKQMNIVGRVYYSKVHEYKKPTARMIEKARKEASIQLAKEKIAQEERLKEMRNMFNPIGVYCEEDDFG